MKKTKWGVRSGINVALLLCVSVAVGSFCSLLQAQAEAGSYWTATADPVVQRHDSPNGMPPKAGQRCTDQPFIYRVRQPSTIFGVWTYADRTEDFCVSSTKFGKVGADILQFSHDKAYKLDIRGLPLMVPNAVSFFYTINAPQSYSHELLYAVDHPAASFEKRPGANGVEYNYSLRAGTNPRPLRHPATGEALHINAVDTSASGEWLIVETKAGVARVNPEDFTDMVVFGQSGSYGTGSDSSLELAISNDGRYAVVSGHNYSETLLYDLSTCVRPEPGSQSLKASSCREKPLRQFLQSQLPGYRSAAAMGFSGDNTRLTFWAQVNNRQERVTLKVPGAPSQQLDYLALGDSFSSGEGDVENRGQYYLPGTNEQVEKCHISSRSYPFAVARHMGLSGEAVKSVACSGGKSEDVDGILKSIENTTYRGQFKTLLGDSFIINEAREDALRSFTPGRAAQIQFVDKYQPGVVTLTMGGNDVGFGDILALCLAPGPSCWHERNKAASGQELARHYQPLKELYRKLRDTSEETAVYVLGYPQFISQENSCGSNVHLNLEEREYIRQSTHYLNKIIAAAARDAGVAYVNMERSLEGKALCDPGLDLAVNGLMAGDDTPSLPVVQRGLFAQESYHPNRLGHQMLAEQFLRAVPDLLADNCAGGSCGSSGTTAVEVPEYFRPPGNLLVQAQQYAQYAVPVIADNIEGAVSGFRATLEGLAPRSHVRFELWSEPVPLGTFTADEFGRLQAELPLPANMPAGHHTLHAYATLPSGEAMDFYQAVFIPGSKSDVDGDGTPNEDDACAFVAPAGRDEDGDGLDDACDPLLSPSPAPKAPTVSVVESINAATAGSVTVSGAGEAGTTAVIAVDDTEAATEPVRTEAVLDGDKYSAQLDLTALTDGELTVRVTLRGIHGTSPAATAAAMKDTRAPRITSMLTPEANRAGWLNSDASVSLDAVDGGGVEHVGYSAEGATSIAGTKTAESRVIVPLTANGRTRLSFYATDTAGNRSETETTEVRIDAVRPTAAIRLPRLAVPGGGLVLDGKLTGGGSDSHAGIDAAEIMLVNALTNKRTTVPVKCVSGCDDGLETQWEVRPAVPTGLYYATVTAADRAGNRGAAGTPLKLLIVTVDNKAFGT